MNATMDDTRREDHPEPASGAPANQYNPSSPDGPADGPSRPVSGERPAALVNAGGRRPDAPEPARRGGAGKWVVLFLIIAAAVVGFLLWRRSGEHKQLAEKTTDLAQNHVTVTRPTSGQAENEIVLPGNLQAFNDAPIFARTNGYLKSWSTDIGAKVKGGQVMAEIEAPDVDAQLRQANGTLAQARANLDIANLNFARQQDLLAKKVNSQQEFDQARTSMDAQKAAVQAAEAAVQNLKVQQGFQNIIAPFDGVVTRRNTDVGALINATGGGQELFRVARMDILRVYVYVPQAYAAYVQEGSEAFLKFAEFPGEKIEGKVAHIAGAIDSTTRTLQTEIEVDNKDGHLFPGSFADVHLSLPLKKAPTVVPVNTLLFRKEGLQVAVVGNDGIVHLRKVTIGEDFGTTLEVTDGVTKEDRIVVNPSDSLQDGTKVEASESAPAKGK